MNSESYQQTVDISVEFEVIPEAPSAEALRTDLAQQAVNGLAGADTTGNDYTKENIEVTAGGE
jgi:hypothetical protein